MSEAIIAECESYVKQTLRNAEGGHDWWHVYRVRKLAVRLAQQEQANLFVVELAALLHDIADSKFHGGDEELGPRLAADFLRKHHVNEEVVQQVVFIIRNISFKTTFDGLDTPVTKELAVVQDADRLDAIGAIGIARTFNYGGFKHRLIYDPAIPPQVYTHKEEYKNTSAPTINHFYEKLLLLKNTMKTNTGKLLAEQRHVFMETYLSQFFDEWEGVK